MLAFGVIFRGRIGPVDNGTEYVAFMLAGTRAVDGHAGLRQSGDWRNHRACQPRQTGCVPQRAPAVACGTVLYVDFP